MCRGRRRSKRGRNVRNYEGWNEKRFKKLNVKREEEKEAKGGREETEKGTVNLVICFFFVFFLCYIFWWYRHAGRMFIINKLQQLCHALILYSSRFICTIYHLPTTTPCFNACAFFVKYVPWGRLFSAAKTCQLILCCSWLQMLKISLQIQMSELLTARGTHDTPTLLNSDCVCNKVIASWIKINTNFFFQRNKWKSQFVTSFMAACVFDVSRWSEQVCGAVFRLYNTVRIK